MHSLVHTDRTFEFVALAPMARVAPLFGAECERDWAHGWNPVFIWPDKPADQLGMVFTIAHGDKRAVWVNTQYDLDDGKFQYVYVIQDTLVTVVTLVLKPRGETTAITVRYERTALGDDASPLVRAMAEQDVRAGPEWERQINAALHRGVCSIR